MCATPPVSAALLTDSWVLSSLLAPGEKAAAHRGVRASLGDADLRSSGCIPRGGIAASHGRFFGFVVLGALEGGTLL